MRRRVSRFPLSLRSSRLTNRRVECVSQPQLDIGGHNLRGKSGRTPGGLEARVGVDGRPSEGSMQEVAEAEETPAVIAYVDDKAL